MLIRALYTLILFIASPVLLFGLYKSKTNKPKFGARWKEHFGFTPKLNSDSKPLWIHAVSVGESIAAIPLIKTLKARSPEQVIVVTTTTSTGAEQIAKLGNLVEHRYMPIDFPFAIKGFLRAVKPKQMLIIETELWPNTLNIVHRAGVPITIVNARLSEKSQRNYQKLQPLFDLMAPTLTQILCQNQADADRFSLLGIEKNKLKVTGSIKFDIHISKEVQQAGKALRESIGPRPVWIAASTHKGEDELVLEAHKAILSSSYPDALLILVPRHPERFDDVYRLCQQQGFLVERRTQQTALTEANVYLGDTMGEMLTLLGGADVCFMGGSLVGDKVGGHNVLEPIALSLPVLTGPSYYNFKDIVEAQIELNSVKVVTSEQLDGAVIQAFEQLVHRTLQPASTLNQKGAVDTTIDHIFETTTYYDFSHL